MRSHDTWGQLFDYLRGFSRIVTGGFVKPEGAFSKGLDEGEAVPANLGAVPASDLGATRSLAEIMSGGRPVVLNFGSCS